MKKSISLILAVLMLLTLLPVSLLANAADETQTTYLGDVNFNGMTDILDYVLTRRYASGSFKPSFDPYSVMDMDGDGTINYGDYYDIKSCLEGTVIEGAAPAGVVTTDSTEKLFDVVISAPESYKAGDRIYVTITIDNITAENGVEVFSMNLNYDNSALAFVECFSYYSSDYSSYYIYREISEDEVNIAVCDIESYPNNGEWCFELMFTALSDSDSTCDFSAKDRSVYGAVYNETEQNFTEFSGNVKLESGGFVFPYLGDINCNGKTEIIDYLYLKRYCFSTFTPEFPEDVMDANRDIAVDKKDYAMIKRVIFDTAIVAEAAPVGIMTTDDSSEKLFDIVINAPESYKKGDTVKVILTVDNITSENGIEVISMLFNYDTSVLSLETEVPADGMIEAIEVKNIDNHCRVVSEGVLNLAACTSDSSKRPENGEWVFTLEFTALADSVSEPDFSVSEESIYGASFIEEEQTFVEFSGGIKTARPLAEGAVVIAPVGDDTLDENTVITASEIEADFILTQLPEDSDKGSAVVYNISINPAPEGEIQLSIAVPEGMDGTKTRVWYIDNGALVDMEATYEDGYLVFTTNAFGSFAIAENARLCGDVDNSGEIDKMDYVMVKRHCFGTVELDTEQLAVANVNGDENVDKNDYLAIKRYCFGTAEISPVYVQGSVE